MTDRNDDDEVRAIEALVARQFASLSWARGAEGDWTAFAADFAAHAVLYPAARPAAPRSIAEFVERMRALARTTLREFRETVLGTEIRIFGNVATAVVAVEATENASETGRGVEMLLLVRSEGAWRIVAQAWDRATPEKPIPVEWTRGALTS